MPTFDEDVIINGNLTVNLGPGQKLKAQSFQEQNAGRMEFGGNELSLISDVNDPPKLRLAAKTPLSAAISFNVLRPDNVTQDEYMLLQCQPDEQQPTSLGGQLKIWCRKRNATGDSSMVLCGVLSTAYSSDGMPHLYWREAPTNNLGPWQSGGGGGGGGGTTSPYTLVGSPINLSGGNSALVAGDGTWLTAVNASLDTEFTASVPYTSGTLKVEVKRTTTGGTQPYLYVWVDGVQVVNGYRPAGTTPELVTIPVSGAGTKTVRVKSAAQSGTCSFGGFSIT